MSTEGSSGAALQFTWDPAKAASNMVKHGVAFTQAATVFADALALTYATHSGFYDPSYSEHTPVTSIETW